VTRAVGETRGLSPCGTKKSLRGGAFGALINLVAKDGIEPPTRGFSISLAAQQAAILLKITPKLKQGMADPKGPLSSLGPAGLRVKNLTMAP